MKITFRTAPHPDADLYLMAVDEGAVKKFAGPYAAALRAVVAANPDFKGASGEMAVAVVPGARVARVGLLGLGRAEGRSLYDLEVAGGKMMGGLIGLPAGHIHVAFAAGVADEEAAALAVGAKLRAYAFTPYRTKQKDKFLPNTLEVAGDAGARKVFEQAAKVADAVHWARDLVNEPPNVLFPDSMARRVVAKLRPLGVKVSVLDDKTLVRKGFGALSAVGRASVHKPRLVVMEYTGPKAKAGKPVALVGKGITFDSGGYSLKTNDGMQDMKQDMAGAAAVAGAMMALAATKAPVRVVAVLALAENMVSDDGYRVCDILSSLSGQTIEVTNTDAEGRLVLSDALWYVQDAYKPRAVVDIATLTGACMVALGDTYGGLFCDDDALLEDMTDAAAVTGDRVWRLPLDPAFDRQLDSTIADMKNSGTTRNGGASIGAAFLSRFIQKDVAWAHIDMAPVMGQRTDSALAPRGATGFGVRLLAEWVSRA